MMKIKQFCQNLMKHYSLIFVILLFVACIFKIAYYVAMADSPYHYDFNLIYGFKVIGWRIGVLILTYILLFSPALFLPKWSRYVYLVLIYALTLGFAFGDLAYSRFFQGAPSIFWNIIPHNVNNDVVTEIGFTKNKYLFFILSDAHFFVDTVLILFMLVWGIAKKKFSYEKFSVKKKIYTTLVPFYSVIIITLSIPSLTIESENSINRVSCYGNFLYHLIDIAELGNYNKNINMSNKDKQAYIKYENLILEDEASATDPLNYASILKDSNLLVFQIEAMESFVIGNYIDGKEITPNINKLLNNSLQLNVKEQVKTGNSCDCDLLFMTGQFPVSKVITINQYEKSDYIALPEVLKSNGYKTMYFNSAYGSTWNYGVMNKTMGFDSMHLGNEIPDSYMDNDGVRDFRTINGYLSDRLVFDYNAELIKSTFTTTDKWYSHVVGSCSHIPYNYPIELDFIKNKKLKKEIGDYMYCYLNAVHIVDDAIGIALEKLETAGYLDNTTIIIQGDHGGIHKYITFETQKKTENKKWSWMLNGSNYTVPVLIYNKNLTGYSIIGKNTDKINNTNYTPDYPKEMICGQVDILPTISYLFDITDGFKYDNGTETVRTLMGRNVLKTNLSYAVAPNYTTYGKLPKNYKLLEKGQYLSDKLIKSAYFGKYTE